MPDVTVSILTCLRADLVRICVGSILIGGEDVNFILTSNGCPEAAKLFKELAAEFPNVTCVENEKNEGFWKPNNHALTLTKTKWLCLVNDDVVVPHGWLTKLKKGFENPESVFACPDNGCFSLDDKFRGFRGERREYCEGACLLIDTGIAKQHGLFEDMPGAAYCEDSHASLRFREMGYRLNWVPLQVGHVGGASSRHIPKAREWHEANQRFCQARWADYLKSKDRKFPCER